LIASTGHSGSQTPQSMHSSGWMTSMCSPHPKPPRLHQQRLKPLSLPQRLKPLSLKLNLPHQHLKPLSLCHRHLSALSQ
jgi:hypothetical protein